MHQDLVVFCMCFLELYNVMSKKHFEIQKALIRDTFYWKMYHIYNVYSIKTVCVTHRLCSCQISKTEFS